MGIKIIMGAPCAGKSTYIDKHSHLLDIVIDLDKICKVFSAAEIDGHYATEEIRSVAIAARAAAVKRAIAISQSKPDIDVWIINADPSPQDLEAYRFLKAEVIKIQATKEICIKRAKQDRPEKFLDLIDYWFDKWDKR